MQLRIDEALSVKLMRTVQQLQKKNEEVQNLFDEGRSLEKENTKLTEEKRVLQVRNRELETQVHRYTEEFSGLQAQVKKQQLKLQQYIDEEIRKSTEKGQPAATKGLKPGKQPAADTKAQTEAQQQIEQLRRRAGTMEESRNAALEAAETYKRGIAMMSEENESLTKEVAALKESSQKDAERFHREVASLKEKEKALKKTLAEFNERKSLVEKETEKLDGIDAKAKEAIKAEFMALALETEKLTEQLEAEKSSGQMLRNDISKQADQLRDLRRLSEESTRIANDEVALLNEQNDVLLRECQRLTSECEILAGRLATVSSTEQAGLSSAVEAARALRDSVEKTLRCTRAIQTDDVDSHLAEIVSSPLMEELDAARRKTEAVQSELQSVVEQNKKLGEKVELFEGAQRSIVANEKMRDEKDLLQEKMRTLLTAENEELKLNLTRLEAQVADLAEHSSPRKVSAQTKDVVPIRYLDEVNQCCYNLLVLAAKVHAACMGHVVDGDSRSSSVDAGCLSLPIAKCDKYELEVLNSVFQRIGGVSHVLKSIRANLYQKSKSRPIRSRGSSAQSSDTETAPQPPQDVTASRVQQNFAQIRNVLLDSESLLDAVRTAKEAKIRSASADPRTCSRQASSEAVPQGSWEDVRYAQLMQAYAAVSDESI